MRLEPLSSAVNQWLQQNVNYLIDTGKLTLTEPTNREQMKICGSGRDPNNGLPWLVCRNRLRDDKITILIFDPRSDVINKMELTLAEFKRECADLYGQIRDAIEGFAKARTVHANQGGAKL
jgi:hypothetical protein